jgi:NlpC/P60 family
VYRKIAYTLPVSLVVLTGHASAGDVVDLAERLIGHPYAWGAEGPKAFDCSGLTQYVFQQVGIDLPRRAIDQSEFGDSARRQLRRGDLVFFSTDDRKTLVTHVGIYDGAGTMINASKRYGRVRRDDLNDSYWTARFMMARHVLSALARSDDERERPADRPRQSNARRIVRDEAVRAIGRLAERLLRR